MGVSLAMRVPPIAGWFSRENPNLKWMMTGGTPISGNLRMMWACTSWSRLMTNMVFNMMSKTRSMGLITICEDDRTWMANIGEPLLCWKNWRMAKLVMFIVLAHVLANYDGASLNFAVSSIPQDCFILAAKEASSVTLVARNPAWILPQRFLGIPLESLPKVSRCQLGMNHSFWPAWLAWSNVETRSTMGES